MSTYESYQHIVRMGDDEVEGILDPFDGDTIITVQPTYNRSIQVRFLAGAPFITYTHNLRTAQKGLEKTDER